MSTHRKGYLAEPGRLKHTTRPVPHTKAQVSQMILYMEPDVILGVSEAIAAVTPDELKGLPKGGNHNGRAIAIICRQWLRAVKAVDTALPKLIDAAVAAAIAKALKGRVK